MGTCANDIDECLAAPCAVGAVCSQDNSADGFACDCTNVDGFEGDTCEDDINECLAASICNFGTCGNTPLGSFTCTCDSGYSGADCTTDIDECTVDASICNSGACTNGAGDYSCDCGTTGYEGDNCETAKASCSEDERVYFGACMACPLGTVNAAGDEPTAGNSDCTVAVAPASVSLTVPLNIDLASLSNEALVTLQTDLLAQFAAIGGFDPADVEKIELYQDGNLIQFSDVVRLTNSPITVVAIFLETATVDVTEVAQTTNTAIAIGDVEVAVTVGGIEVTATVTEPVIAADNCGFFPCGTSVSVIYATTGCVTTDGDQTCSDFVTEGVASEICGTSEAQFGSAPFACDFECDESCGGMEVSGFVAFAEGAIDNSTIFGDWGDFPADGQTLLEIPLDQLTEGSSVTDFKLDVLEFLKEGKIAGDDGDCDHVHGKGTKGKKSKKNKGDKTPKAAKKKGGKKGKLNQLAAKMAVKRTSQVAVALLGSMLMVAAVAGYRNGKKKTLSEGETQMLLPAANPEDVAVDLHLTYVLP